MPASLVFFLLLLTSLTAVADTLPRTLTGSWSGYATIIENKDGDARVPGYTCKQATANAISLGRSCLIHDQLGELLQLTITCQDPNLSAKGQASFIQVPYVCQYVFGTGDSSVKPLGPFFTELDVGQVYPTYSLFLHEVPNSSNIEFKFNVQSHAGGFETTYDAHFMR